MEVRWSLAEDLERICERIERDNPEAARRIARTIYDGCARLKDFPRLGRASNRIDRTAGTGLFTPAVRCGLSSHGLRHRNLAYLPRRARLAIGQLCSAALKGSSQAASLQVRDPTVHRVPWG